MYVDDAARAAVFLMSHYSGNEPINIGVGQDRTIRELADLVKQVVGYQGELVFDTTKPDGVPQKLLDISALNVMGWNALTTLEEGVASAYEWYRDSAAAAPVKNSSSWGDAERTSSWSSGLLLLASRNPASVQRKSRP